LGAPECRGPLCTAQPAQSIATPLIAGYAYVGLEQWFLQAQLIEESGFYQSINQALFQTENVHSKYVIIINSGKKQK